MDMIGKIRRLHSRDKKSKREISRTTGIARNTVAKWLDAPSPSTGPKCRRAEQPNKLTAFHEAIKLALKADAHRPKHERRTARALFAEVKAAGYEGGYSRLTDFIREWRLGVGQAALVNAFVPLSFELGEAFQFDWSEEGLVIGGIYYHSTYSMGSYAAQAWAQTAGLFQTFRHAERAATRCPFRVFARHQQNHANDPLLTLRSQISTPQSGRSTLKLSGWRSLLLECRVGPVCCHEKPRRLHRITDRRVG